MNIFALTLLHNYIKPTKELRIVNKTLLIYTLFDKLIKKKKTIIINVFKAFLKKNIQNTNFLLITKKDNKNPRF